MVNRKVENNTQSMKNLFLKNPVRALMGLSLLLAVSFLALPVYGQTPGSLTAPAPAGNINTVDDVFVLINQIFNILFWLLIVLAALFIIWAAFTYLTAAGDSEKITKANHRVIFAAVAVVVGVLAKAIPTVVCNFISTTGCNISPTGIPQ
jgi:hypothetical protein